MFIVRVLKKGAEANIYSARFLDRKVIVKRRIKKAYRIKEINYKIRSLRTAHEAQLLYEAKASAGVPTPNIYLVDRDRAEIIMEYVEGTRLKEILDEMPSESVGDICSRLGGLIADLHGVGIIHGDLTTSNVIVKQDGNLFLIDFGLGFHSNLVEDQGVDLHLLKQIFESFHLLQAIRAFQAVLKGYGAVVGKEMLEEVMRKIREIEGRGRYVAAEARNST